MIFKDGLRKAGFFEENIYKKPLTSMKEFEDWVKQNNLKIPEAFRQEIKEYIGLLGPTDDNTKFLNTELKPPEKEDLMATNQLQNI